MDAAMPFPGAGDQSYKKIMNSYQQVQERSERTNKMLDKMNEAKEAADSKSIQNQLRNGLNSALSNKLNQGKIGDAIKLAKTAKKVTTIIGLLTSGPVLIGIGIFILVLITIGFIMYTIYERPLDHLDVLTQCTDISTCSKVSLERISREEPTSCGSQENPCETRL